MPTYIENTIAIRKEIAKNHISDGEFDFSTLIKIPEQSDLSVTAYWGTYEAHDTEYHTHHQFNDYLEIKFLTDWKRPSKIINELFKRYPKEQIVWCCSEEDSEYIDIYYREDGIVHKTTKEKYLLSFMLATLL